MKTIRLLAVSLMSTLFFVGMLVTPPEGFSKTIRLKFSDPSSAGTARTDASLKWGNWLEERTGGRVKIEWYWSQSLTKARDNINATKGGICDLSTNSSWAYHKSLFPIWQFSELVFLGKADWDAHARTCKELYETIPALKEECDKTGLKLVAIVSIHPTNFVSKVPINTLEDFKGRTIRAIGSIGDWVKAVGGAPVGLTVYETYEALQKGTVDASQGYMYTYLPYKWSEVIKYSIMPGFHNITAQYWMNAGVWKKLPEDIQKIFETEAWDKMLELTAQEFDKDWDNSISELKKAGVEFITISPGEIKRWQAVAQESVHAKWLKEMEAKGVDGQKILDQYQEVYKKYDRGNR